MEGLLSALLFAGLFYLMMRFACGRHMAHVHVGPDDHGHTGGPHTLRAGTDPVCGMEVASDQGYAAIYGGHTYRLCSRACLDRFEANPDEYVTPAAA